MIENLEMVEVGIVVNLETLRDIMKNLSVAGRSWWLASFEEDIRESEYVMIGHRDANCEDRLNKAFFRVPIVGNNEMMRPIGDVVILIPPSTTRPEEPGFYLDQGRIVNDPIEDFLLFYEPLKKALIARLREGD